METKTQNKKLIALGSNNAEYEFSVNSSYEYSFQKKKIKVELIEEADGFTILSVNGLRYPVEVVSHKQNTYEVLVNGVSYSFSIETPFSLKRSKLLASQKSESKKELIKAPMPGKILDVMVEKGQSVNLGEGLFVLEAMKMQNTIASPVKGVISKVSIKPGDIVGKEELLVEIEKS